VVRAAAGSTASARVAILARRAVKVVIGVVPRFGGALGCVR
jgi:hypothetical protein